MRCLARLAVGPGLKITSLGIENDGLKIVLSSQGVNFFNDINIAKVVGGLHRKSDWKDD